MEDGPHIKGMGVCPSQSGAVGCGLAPWGLASAAPRAPPWPALAWHWHPPLPLTHPPTRCPPCKTVSSACILSVYTRTHASALRLRMHCLALLLLLLLGVADEAAGAPVPAIQWPNG